MEKVNFKSIQEYVSTQYGDLTGVVQIDGHENITSIYKLCDDYGFNTSDKFIVGFGLEDSAIKGVGKRAEVYCKVLYVLKEEYGNSYEEIESKVKETSTLKLKQKNILIKYSEIGKYIKRFDFLATTALTKSANNLEIQEEHEN